MLKKLIRKQSLKFENISQLENQVNSKITNHTNHENYNINIEQSESIKNVYNKKQDSTLIYNEFCFTNTQLPPLLVLSGSFNPLHHGHLKMIDVAKSYQPQHLCLFEISIRNCDKGNISLEQIYKRVDQFVTRKLPVMITNQTLFIDKVKLLKLQSVDIVFAIGSDTIERIFDQKQQESKDVFIKEINQLLNCTELLAFGRKNQKSENDDFIDPFSIIRNASENRVIENDKINKIKQISQNEFNVDISSSELRSKGITL